MLSVINSNGRSKGWSVCSFSFSVWIYSRWMIQGRKPKQKIIKTRYWRYCMFQLQPLRNPHMGWIYLSWMKKIKTQEELINSQGTECLVAQLVKNPPAMQETSVRSLGSSYPLQCSGLENSMGCIVHGSQRVRHDWATFTFIFVGG